MSTQAAPERAGSGLSLAAEERDLIRSLIMTEPDLVLGDDQVMQALIGDSHGAGRQVVDLRDRLVQRLESRLKRLVEANRSMIAAAYENVAGTQQLHRAVLTLVASRDLGGLLRSLTGETPGMLGVEEARLCIEADIAETRAADDLAEGVGDRVLLLPEGTVEAYLLIDGGTHNDPVALRPAGCEAELIFGPLTAVRSEALVRLDLEGATGLLAFGAGDPERFSADQGTDLLGFFGGVVERLLVQRLAEAEAAGVR